MASSCCVTDRFVQALAYAAQKHGNQSRKGKDTPYVSHLLQVAGLVMEFGGTEDEAIAGLLHDAAEDAGGEPTLEEIRTAFGEAVEQIVRENSDSITESKDKKAPWRERKERYMAGIGKADESALLVSLCDKIHNVRELVFDCRHVGESHWDRFNASKGDILWYYRALVSKFEERARNSSRLSTAVSELKEAVCTLAAVADGH